MADTTAQTPSLSEQYLLKEKEEKPEVASKSVEVKEEKSETAAEKAEEVLPAAAEEKTEEDTTGGTTAAESTETNPTTAASSEDAPAVDADASEEQNPSEEEAAEEAPEIKLETAPADYRFPTTNQTRHCFTRYVEYYRCVAAKSEGAPECDKFAKYYRSLCPGEWIDRWNEQRENGTFPGPL